jgi:hypothetical protein
VPIPNISQNNFEKSIPDSGCWYQFQ